VARPEEIGLRMKTLERERERERVRVALVEMMVETRLM
jgi:hypothetical protein